MVRELAMQAECVASSTTRPSALWRLRVERENLRAPALREKLQAAVAPGRGACRSRLEVEAGAVVDTPAARDAAERERRQAEAERIIHDDPLVKALMAQYKTARIVPGLGQAALARPLNAATHGRDEIEGAHDMMKGQLAGLMKQAQAMQDNLKKAQDELATIEVEGQSGAGLVKVTMTCKHDVKRIAIDPSLLADDKDMLEDLVAAAFNDGVRRAEEVSQEKMGKLTAGMPLPPGMKLPF